MAGFFARLPEQPWPNLDRLSGHRILVRRHFRVEWPDLRPTDPFCPAGFIGRVRAFRIKQKLTRPKMANPAANKMVAVAT